MYPVTHMSASSVGFWATYGAFILRMGFFQHAGSISYSRQYRNVLSIMGVDTSGIISALVKPKHESTDNIGCYLVNLLYHLGVADAQEISYLVLVKLDGSGR